MVHIEKGIKPGVVKILHAACNPSVKRVVRRPFHVPLSLNTRDWISRKPLDFGVAARIVKERRTE
jgi:hypothetical protein